MRPIAHKEKKDLFFQYLVAFVLTAGLLLGALFLPQGDSNIAINDVDKELFKEFSDFEKTKPALIKLIDTVQSEAKGIMNQNAGGEAAKRTSDDLIEDFNSSNTASPFVKSITDLLSIHINTTSDINKNQDDIIKNKKKLEDCGGELKNERLIQRIKTQPEAPPITP